MGKCRSIGKRGDIGQSVSMCMCVKLIHVVNMPFSWFWHDETVQAIANQLATMPQLEPDVVTVVIMPPLMVSNHKWLRHDHHDHKYSSLIS